jgi:hypothetical protein
MARRWRRRYPRWRRRSARESRAKREKHGVHTMYPLLLYISDLDLSRYAYLETFWCIDKCKFKQVRVLCLWIEEIHH